MSDKTPDKVVDFKSFGDKPTRGGSTGLYIGNKNSAKALGILKEHGIKYILNCTPTRNVDPEAGCPNFFEKDPSLTYKRIGIFDNRGEDIIQHMEAAIAFIEQGKHYGSVLVHCNKGVSRSASFVIGYLMKIGGMSLAEAMDLLRSKRSIVQPNDSFMSQLERYEEMVKKEREAKARQLKSMGSRAPATVAAGGGGAAGSSSPAKRAAIGPAMPPGVGKIGPSLPPPSSAPSSTSTPIGPSPPPATKSAPIGPAMPPKASSSKPSTTAIGPSLPPTIGPSCPPLAEPPAPTANKAAAIGPAMPPKEHSKGKRTSEEASPSPPAKRRQVNGEEKKEEEEGRIGS